MNTFLKTFGFISFIFLTLSCSKTDADKPSIYALLTNRSTKTWVNYSKIDNGTEQLIDCDTDDEWVFHTDGTIDLNTGAVRCFINQTNKKAYYNFLLAGSNNDQFYFRYGEFGNFFTVKGTVTELTETNFKFRYSFVSKEGTEESTVEYAFKKSEF